MSSPHNNNTKPSLLQRIVCFIDSPCGASSSLDVEVPLPTRSICDAQTNQPSQHKDRVINDPHVVTPIKSPLTEGLVTLTNTNRRKNARNRSYASHQVRKDKLRELLIGLQLTRHEEAVLLNEQPSLRRTKSLQVTPSPNSVAATNNIFWTDSTNQVDSVYCRPIQACINSSSSPNRFMQGDYTTSAWCCHDVMSPNLIEPNSPPTTTLPNTSQVACNGYVDYAGQHHPHEPTNDCQGCIFRESLFDGSDTRTSNDEELYYDSDYEFYCRYSEEDEEGAIVTPTRGKYHNHPPSNSLDDQQSFDLTHESSPGRHAYMYDYFTSNNQSHQVASLKTGMNATPLVDVGDCVQEALNSTWKLSWHTNNSDTKSAFLLHPKPCNVWIERGYRRNFNQAVEPRLMWREIKPAHNTNYTDLIEQRPNSLSLLAIRRIMPGELVAESFIFSKSNHMIVVKSSLGRDYYFEVSFSAERDHILHLWKMTTARLVSYAATQSTEQMMEEFFNEYSVHC